MRLVSGKTVRMHGKILLLPLMFLFPLMNACAELSLGAFIAPARALTWVEGLDSGSHEGFASGIDGRWIFLRPAGSDKPSVPAHDGKTPKAGIILFTGFSLQYIDMQASNWLSDGSRFRAWNALAMAPYIGIGVAFRGSWPEAEQRLALSAGPSASFSNYSGTSLYSAYWSGWLRPEWELGIGRHLHFSLELPIEYCARADGTSVLAGIGLGVRYVF